MITKTPKRFEVGGKAQDLKGQGRGMAESGTDYRKTFITS